MIDNRMIAILMELFTSEETQLYELEIQTGVDRNHLLSHIQRVNEFLEDQGFEVIRINNDICQVPPQLIEHRKHIFDLLKYQDIYLSQDERQLLIYLYTFIRKEFVSNVHYQELLKVSRNTTLSDIKSVRELTQEFDIVVNYTRSEGYHLEGNEIDKHRLALFAISRCLQSSLGSLALDYLLRAWNEKNHISHLRQEIRRLCEFYQVIPLEDRLDEFLYFIQFLVVRYLRVGYQQLVFLEQPLATLADLVTELWQTVSDATLSDDWIRYLAHLLQGCLEGSSLSNDVLFDSLTLNIVEEMERLSLIEFDNRSQLIEGLKNHLIPAYARIKANVVVVNTYTKVIKDEHKELFSLVKKALRPLEEHLGLTIPDSEISYFVIHFGGYIEKAQYKQFLYKALVVCPNGVSSSLILKDSLRQLFPNIQFSDRHYLSDINDIGNNYHMVFSTVRLETELPF